MIYFCDPRWKVIDRKCSGFLFSRDFYFLVVCFSCGEGGGILVQGGGDVLGLPDEKKSELVERDEDGGGGRWRWLRGGGGGVE